MSQVYMLLADCDERSSNLTSFHNLLVNITASDGEILKIWDGFKFMVADKSFTVFNFSLEMSFLSWATNLYNYFPWKKLDQKFLQV